MALRFGKLADLLDECQGFTEVLKPEGALDPAGIVEQRPFGGLPAQRVGLLRGQRRHAATAGRAGLLGEICRHVCFLAHPASVSNVGTAAAARQSSRSVARMERKRNPGLTSHIVAAQNEALIPDCVVAPSWLRAVRPTAAPHRNPTAR